MDVDPHQLMCILAATESFPETLKIQALAKKPGKPCP